LQRAERAGQTSRNTCGEIAKLYLHGGCCLKSRLVCTQNTLVMPGLDPGIHPSSQEVFSKKMDCRVKPGNDDSSTFAPTHGLL
jgi:hypothetical protein